MSFEQLKRNTEKIEFIRLLIFLLKIMKIKFCNMIYKYKILEIIIYYLINII